jgi:CBS domain containing-hemolysin-like protein
MDENITAAGGETEPESSKPHEAATSAANEDLTQQLLRRNGNGSADANGQDAGLWQRMKKKIPFFKADTSVRAAIEELIEEEIGADDHSVEAHERALISNILELRDLPVVDVMVPRADIVAVDIRITRADLMTVLSEKPHSRLPVYHDTLDNVIGVVHLKDLVATIGEEKPKKSESFDLRHYLRNVLVVSPSMRVLDLLLQMRQSRLHTAMVVDEYGGIDGLITINDLIEAIVGEIDDEHSLHIQPQLIERKDGTILVDARYDVDDLEEKYGKFMTEEEREEVDTLGGLVNLLAGHVPSRGEVIVHSAGLEFEVLDADPRRIHRLCIRNMYKTI